METKEKKGGAKRPTLNEGASPLACLVTSFLKERGFEAYRIQSMQEAYEIKGNNEILRIYVTKKRQIERAT